MILVLSQLYPKCKQAKFRPNEQTMDNLRKWNLQEIYKFLHSKEQNKNYPNLCKHQVDDQGVGCKEQLST